MAVDAHIHHFEIIDYGLCRRAAPKTLKLGSLRRKGIPIRLRVVVSGVRALSARLRLVIIPVKRDGSLIEKTVPAVARLVNVVPFRLAELIEVKDMGAESEFVIRLHHLNWRTGPSRKRKDAVGLSVRLDIGIDFTLLVLVPDFPIRFAHHAWIASGGNAALRKIQTGRTAPCGCRKCERQRKNVKLHNRDLKP